MELQSGNWLNMRWTGCERGRRVIHLQWMSLSEPSAPALLGAAAGSGAGVLGRRRVAERQRSRAPRLVEVWWGDSLADSLSSVTVAAVCLSRPSVTREVRGVRSAWRGSRVAGYFRGF